MKLIHWLAILMVSGALTGRAGDAVRSLTLDEAIQLALTKNPDLAAAQSRVRGAQAGLQQVTAAFLPQVRVSAGYAASDNPVQAFMMTLNQRAFSFAGDFNHPDVTDNLNAKVVASYSLYNGGRDTATRAAVKLGSEAVAHSLDAVRNDLVFEVTRSFYNIQKARAFVSAAEAAVQSLESTLKTAQNRIEQGAALKTDALDAEVRLAEARENLVRARNAVALTETIFRNVIGVGEKESVTASPEVPRTAGKDQAAGERPELAAARKMVAAAEKQVRAAQSGHLPRVNAFASYDLDSGNARDYADSWLAGVSVELDVFDGFQTRGKVAEARARLTEAREQLRKMDLALQLEVRQAELNVQEAAARLETTARAVEQARESLQLTKERYAGGLALFTQVLDAETALTSARQRRAAAETDVRIARAALDKALGRNWKESK